MYNEGENTQPLKISTLTSGMYFIQLSDGLRLLPRP